MKRILITGKNSYVGKNIEKWLTKYSDRYSTDSISLRGDLWKETDFSQYDVVLHVAAMVHKKETPNMETMYFEINRDLSIELAKRVKASGVNQFIFMSTMAVYGVEGKNGQEVVITRETQPNPKTFYGRSKLEAESELMKLSNESFKLVILRPPMIYGPNCPGNYTRLQRLAINSPIFPLVDNKRSMLNVDNLCMYIRKYIDLMVEGVYFPQDEEYVNTSHLVKKLAEESGNNIYLSKILGRIIKLFGNRIDLLNKVFGNLVYEKTDDLKKNQGMGS
jgi:UDP-glucose 4-epimerase